MTVLVWVAEGTWPACIDAAARWAPTSSDIELITVNEQDEAATAHGAFVGLLGRGRNLRDPGPRIAALDSAATTAMLDAARARLGRSCITRALTGRPERAVVEASTGADLLVLARDGDVTHLGPHSLGPMTRFVVDHAPCPVLLVWPQRPTSTALPPHPDAVPPAPPR